MRIIPVIDVMGGLAVHAKGGPRNRYVPLRTPLCPTSDPVDVALAFRSAYRFEELYVADLDAIMGQGENLKIIRTISRKSGMRLMVDAGVDSVEKAKELLQAEVDRIIVGTETLKSFRALQRILNHAGVDRVTVSIDLMKGHVLSKCKTMIKLGPKRVAKRLEEMGVREIIVLDLARVGRLSGVDIDLMAELSTSINVTILVGGGIRGVHDLLLLRKLGVKGVLASTALHEMRITKNDLDTVREY